MVFIIVRHPSFKTTAGLISSSFSKVTRLWVEALSEVIPSFIDVTYCIILIVYSPQPYPILFVTTGDQVCLGRSPDEMAMRPPLLVNHPPPPQPCTYQSTLPHPHLQHNPHLHHCLLL